MGCGSSSTRRKLRKSILSKYNDEKDINSFLKNRTSSEIMIIMRPPIEIGYDFMCNNHIFIVKKIIQTNVICRYYGTLNDIGTLKQIRNTRFKYLETGEHHYFSYSLGKLRESDKLNYIGSNKYDSGYCNGAMYVINEFKDVTHCLSKTFIG